MKIFDSNERFHYLVCPRAEMFVPDTLEKLTYYEFTYRLLREAGYKRIVFIAYHLESDKFKFKTYDRFSYATFTCPSNFKNSDLSDESVEKICNTLDGLAGSTLKLNGIDDVEMPKVNKKFPSNSFGEFWSPIEISDTKTDTKSVCTFSEVFTRYIIPALNEKRFKTAIIIPADAFEKLKLDRSAVTKLKTSVEEETAFNNIIIFQMNNKKEIKYLLPYTRALGNVGNISDMTLTDGADGITYSYNTEKYFESLRKSRCLLELDKAGTDEIINALLREKLVNKTFKGLPYDKVEAIAERISMQFKSGEVFFESLDFDANELILNKIINKFPSKEEMENEFSKEVESVAKRLKSRKIISEYTSELTNMERISGIRTKMSEYGSYDDLLKEFDKYIGDEIKSTKQSVIDIINTFEALKKTRDEIIQKGEVPKEDPPYMNMKFIGPPGCGKTKIAEIVAKLLYAKGILPSDKYTKVDAQELIDDSGTKGITEGNIKRVAEEANGGVLVIDEFYQFNSPYRGGNIANDASNALLTVINKHYKSLCIIVCGYENEVNEVLSKNAGVPRRFPHTVQFKEYSTDTLMKILRLGLKNKKRTLEEGVLEMLEKVIEADKAVLGKDFGNAGYINNMLFKLENRYINSHSSDGVYTKETVLSAFEEKAHILTKGSESISDVLEMFDRLYGKEIGKVKSQILESLALFEEEKNEREYAKKNGLFVEDVPYMNMVFSGPPGVGKTKVAEITAKLMCLKGYLPSDNVVKLDASKLLKTGGHKGVLEENIDEYVKKAIGGVLIIDEFYALNSPYDGGNMANDAMCAILSAINDNYDKLCIIICGYKDEVMAVLEFNDGADRRFPHIIDFENYSVDTLMEIFAKTIERRGKSLQEEATDAVRHIIECEMDKKGTSFGNAGYIQNLIGNIKKKYISRGENDNIYKLCDVINAYPEYFEVK